MRYILSIAIFLFLSLPALAEQEFFLEEIPAKPKDSVEKIVEDYRLIESLFKSGDLGRMEHRNALIELQKRAERENKCDEFCLEAPYWDPNYPTFLKILSGFKQEPS